MDEGMNVLWGMVLFVLAIYIFVVIAPPIILDIIWIVRAKKGKSKWFGPLGIVTIIVNALSLLGLPTLFAILGDLFGWT